MENVEDQLEDLAINNGNNEDENQDVYQNGNIVAGNQRASLDVIVKDEEDVDAIPPPKVHPTNPIQVVSVPSHVSNVPAALYRVSSVVQPSPPNTVEAQVWAISPSSPYIEAALNWHRLANDFLDQLHRIAELPSHSNPVQVRKALG